MDQDMYVQNVYSHANNVYKIMFVLVVFKGIMLIIGMSVLNVDKDVHNVTKMDVFFVIKGII
jgi:hypothetical protein